MPIEITATGVQDTIDALVAMGGRTKNVGPAWADVHDAFIKDEIDLFASGGATGKHGKWPPNRASTVSSKGHAMVLRGPPKKGWNLKASCTVPSHPDHIFLVTPLAIEMGTKDPKARRMAEGRGNFPERRPVDATDAQIKHYANIVAIFIVEGPQ